MDAKVIKIMMTTDTISGVWTFTVNLCRDLRPYGVQIYLASLGAFPSAAQENELITQDHVCLYKSDFRLEWMKNPWEDVQRTRKWLNAIYTRVKPHVFLFNNFTDIHPSWTCSLVTVYHSCVPSWWEAVRGSVLPGKWQQFQSLLKSHLEKTEIVVSPTLSMLKMAFKNPAQSNYRVIHNGSYTSRKGKAKKEKFILCSGRVWNEGENLQSLASIAGKVSWPIYVAGQTLHPDTGHHTAIKNVRLLGQVSGAQLQNLLESAGIFISPAIYEPFGMGVLEAANAEYALVLNNIDTYRELWDHCALFTDADNISDFSEKVQYLIDNAKYRHHLA